MFFKERAAASEKKKCTTASERKNVQLLLNIFFLCVAAFGCISFFLRNMRLFLKEKTCSCFLELCSLKKCFEVKQLK